MTVRHYSDLVAWQKAMDLVEEVYRITKAFPKAEIYGLSSQLRRAAVSIPSNIAEGQSRREFVPANPRSGRRRISRRFRSIGWRRFITSTTGPIMPCW